MNNIIKSLELLEDKSDADVFRLWRTQDISSIMKSTGKTFGQLKALLSDRKGWKEAVDQYKGKE